VSKFQDLLQAEFRPFGELTSDQLSRLEGHHDLLMRWNSRLNLTRIVDLKEVVQFHYCESLFLARSLPTGPLIVADLGSGAGFPGIPAAVVRPDLHMVLIESDARKAVFLREATRELTNVEVLVCRFEDCPRRFDWALARAVAPENVLASRLADNFALLVGREDIPLGSHRVEVPWGRSRVLAIVSRGTQDVSRETRP
jgi:16S rRNA (guanine(527)-N(7))-methyltransferase RsmG